MVKDVIMTTAVCVHGVFLHFPSHTPWSWLQYVVESWTPEPGFTNKMKSKNLSVKKCPASKIIMIIYIAFWLTFVFKKRNQQLNHYIINMHIFLNSTIKSHREANHFLSKLLMWNYIIHRTLINISLLKSKR